MATRSTIAAKLQDGSYKAIYCHNDGYLSGVGEVLLKHYTTPEKIEALLALGQISSLDAECTAPEDHSYENPQEGYTVAYHRDRGEKWEDNAPGTGATYQEALRNAGGSQAFNYLWEDGAWRVDGQPLTAEEIAKDE